MRGVVFALCLAAPVGRLAAEPSLPPSSGSSRQLPEIDPTLMACLADRLWPEVPAGHDVSVEDRIADRVGAFGNALGGHLSLLSRDLVGLRVDGRGQRARVLLGGGSPHFLELKLDGDVHFTDGLAKVKARLDLGIAGHALHVELPEFDMSPESLAGNTYVELRLPLFRRSF
jgi:hypothetical protein